MSTRRNFFKFLSIGTAAAAGGAVTAATLITSNEKTDAVKKIEEAGFNGKVTIGAEYGERTYPKGANGGTGYILAQPQFVPGTRKHVTASLAVGPDGEMYLMTNGKWRRIVTE